MKVKISVVDGLIASMHVPMLIKKLIVKAVNVFYGAYNSYVTYHELLQVDFEI